MRVLVLSPHYDDAPLSLGQSMLDGALSEHRVTVGVVFSRSNWTIWFHPTRRRWPLANGWSVIALPMLHLPIKVVGGDYRWRAFKP